MPTFWKKYFFKLLTFFPHIEKLCKKCRSVYRHYRFKIIQSKLGLKAYSVSKNHPDKQKQILYDISDLIKHDRHSGIQRVVRGYMNELLKKTPKNYCFEPIYFCEKKGVYYYARSYVANLYSQRLPNDVKIKKQDAIIDVYKGDIFLSIDLNLTYMDYRKEIYQRWKEQGVFLYFMVYDLLPILHPEYFLNGMDYALSDWLKSMVSVSNGCVCISHTVAEELKEWFSNIQLEKNASFRIDWLHLAADVQESFPSKGFSEQFSSVLNTIIACPSIVTIGTIEPRKGYDQALEAFEILWSQGADVNWVIVGKSGWKTEKLVDKIKKHPQRNKHIFWFEGASDDILLALYEKASGCLMPSHGEGFGLPLIEAAQHQVPILARDIPVFREVGQEYVTYFTADSSSELAQALNLWLKQLKNKTAISSANMPWMTWAQSTQKLFGIVLK